MNKEIKAIKEFMNSLILMRAWSEKHHTGPQEETLNKVIEELYNILEYYKVEIDE